MHADHYSSRYPTSPLSPKLSTGHRPMSPPGNPRLGNHGRHTSRNMQLNLGRFHPSNFPQADITGLGSKSNDHHQAPAITFTRAPQPVQLESPRLMREKQREFIEKARLSSKLAASPLAVKPDAPRLDPLGSPKGPVTPLELEESTDYFQMGAGSKAAQPGSPGFRSFRSDSSSPEDCNPAKSRKIDFYA